jgi:16S rRNA U516 pseudouridylate synthase RsuA-like enzyme
MSRRKLTASEKAAKKLRRQQFMTIFVNGKQKRVRRPIMIEGLETDEFIRQNADPIWLHQNEMWELIEPEEPEKF